MTLLKQVPFHEEREILDIVAESVVRDRLLELGFVPGSTVQVLLSLPFSGPFVVQVGSLTVALRVEEMDCVWVK